jgi:hypothetical protein
MKFNDRIKELGFASYDDYLSSPHWHNFKIRYRDSGLSMRCAVCGRGKIQLHHHTYVRLGQEKLDDVTPVCREHHKAIHEWLKSGGRIFVEFTHEAIAHLRGEKIVVVEPVWVKHRDRQIQKKKRLKNERKHSKAALRIAEAGKSIPDADIKAVMDQMGLLSPTSKQIATMNRFAEKRNLPAMKGLIKSIEISTTEKKRREAHESVKAAAEASLVAWRNERAPARIIPKPSAGNSKRTKKNKRRGVARRSATGVIDIMREKWKNDPLYAIRMMGNGQRPLR